LAFTTGVTLTPRKLAVIVVFTREQAESSAIEVIARAMILEAVGLALDATMLGNVAGDATKPPGLLVGVTPLTATTGGGVNAMMVDLGNLVQALATAHGGKTPLFIAAPAQAVAMKASLGPHWDYPVVASASLVAGEIICLELASFVSAFGADPEFDTVRAALFHFEDTSPATDPMTGTPSRSLFQTDQVGLRMILHGSWGMRATGQVAYLPGATW
jgi:hypothetical protein